MYGSFASHHVLKLESKLHGLSPQVNYTDWLSDRRKLESSNFKMVTQHSIVLCDVDASSDMF
jgi:hypothetical protein